KAPAARPAAKPPVIRAKTAPKAAPKSALKSAPKTAPKTAPAPAAPTTTKARGPAKGKGAPRLSSAAKVILAARPAPIMLVPRVPSPTDSQGKPVVAAPVKPARKSKKLRAEKKPPAEPAYR